MTLSKRTVEWNLRVQPLPLLSPVIVLSIGVVVVILIVVVVLIVVVIALPPPKW